MIKFCIVLALLAAVAQSTVCAASALNVIITNQQFCKCAETSNDPDDLTVTTKWCSKIDGVWALVNTIPSECPNANRVTNTPCLSRASAPGTKICVNDEYKSGSNECSAWCDKGAGTKCVTCTATQNQCGTCNPGYDTPASTACTACTSGKFTAGGATACANCAAGKYSAAAASVCINYDCTPANTATGCKTCITQTSRTKTDHCSECKAGSGLDAGACAACEAEKFSDGTSSCADCAAGKYSAAAASVCIAYTCATSTATTSCLTCKADADRTANDHCATCNKGYKISGKVCATDATSASSSMSLGVQTAVLIGMMNFV